MSLLIKMLPFRKKASFSLLPARSAHGFTLIELLVVITIIGVLATISFALLNPRSLLGQSKDAKRKNDIKQIQNALQQYYNDNKRYPEFGDYSTNSWVNITSLGLVPTYLKQYPADPISGRVYEYLEPDANGGCTDNQAYALRANLDIPVTNTAVWCNGTTTNLTSSPYYYVTSD